MMKHQARHKMPNKQRGSAIVYIVLAIIIFSGVMGAILFKNKQFPAPVEQTSQLSEPTATVTVYKSATCGCCSKWITHLENEGFNVVAYNREDMMTIKQDAGLQPELASCHTAFVDGYVVEGHVPANDIKRLLVERPAILGLTAPGMPQKSPGMQTEGLAPQGYDVLAFDKAGNAEVFTSY